MWNRQVSERVQRRPLTEPFEGATIQAPQGLYGGKKFPQLKSGQAPGGMEVEIGNERAMTVKWCRNGYQHQLSGYSFCKANVNQSTFKA